MKVYGGSNPTKHDYKKVPQIKIKNEDLKKSGFDIGVEYNINYLPGKLVLEVIVEKEYSCRFQEQKQ